MAESDADDSILKNEEPIPAASEPPAVPRAGSEQADGTRSVAALSVTIGCGLAFLGVIAGILALLDAAPWPATALVPQVKGGVRAAWLVLAFGLGGWAAFCVLRLVSSFLRERFERDSRRLDQLEAGLDRAVRLLERIAEGVERRAETGGFDPAVSLGRGRAVLEIEAAIRGAQWPLAESLLGAFEAAFSGDPMSDRLRDGLASARRSVLQERMAELTAARGVGDPARVLELFGMVAAELEAEPLKVLQSEVAQWFLTLIYRRLRTGKIQVEVVELAARFAHSFAATTEGASVMAALPTLRRSAGLCPRCGQPYIGLEQACLECLRPGGTAPAPSVPSSDSIPSE